MYESVTNNIRIAVKPTYLEKESSPAENLYVWAYHVRIENVGTETVQLRSRCWRITDSDGFTKEVSGEGVVGEQPLLRPGDIFEYTSGAPLRAPGGIMVGNFVMEANGGRSFLVNIPAFSLDSPYQHPSIH